MKHRTSLVFSAVFISLIVIAEVIISSFLIPSYIRGVKTSVATADFFNLLAHLTAIWCSIGFVFFLIAALFIRTRISGFIPWAVIVFESLFFIMLIADYKTYKIMGLHLDSDFVISSLSSNGFFHEVRLGMATVITAILAIAATIGFFSLLMVAAKRIHLGRAVLVIPLVLLVVGVSSSIMALEFLHGAVRRSDALLDSIPYVNVLTYHGSDISLEANYPPKIDAPKIIGKKDVLFVLVESWRSTSFNPELMPELTAFTSRHPVILSEHHFAGSHCTQYGVFSYLYGLSPFHYAVFRDGNVPSFPLSVLKQNGYTLHGFCSASLKEWGKAGFIISQLNEYKEIVKDQTFLADQEMISDVVKLLKTPSDHPRFIFMFVNSTHQSYFYPKEFEKYTPALSDNFNYMQGDDALRESKDLLFNRYKNSVRFVDSILGGMLESLNGELNGGNLAVAITGDHGEEFFEHGKYGHASDTTLIKERTEVPLILFLPGEKAKKVRLSSHSDIFPTLFDSLKLSPSVSPDVFSSGISLLPPADPRTRYVAVTAGGFPFIGQRLCLTDGREKFTYLKGLGSVHRYTQLSHTTMEDVPVDSAKSDAAMKDVMMGQFHQNIDRFLMNRNTAARQ